MNFIEGSFLLIDKPLNWTSFQVVDKVRWAIKKHLGVKDIKVGHAGTLDPLATGLLVIATGKFTKQIDEVQGQIKTYTGTFFMGATTPSYDAETAIDATFDISNLSAEQLQATAQQFVGTIQQTPPIYSAIKVDGKRAYESARQGKEITLQARPVQIYKLELPRIELPEVDFEVQCSKGTYIRTLAHDFGKQLHNGAYLTKLRRTQIGDFNVQDAWQLEAFVEHILNTKS